MISKLKKLSCAVGLVAVCASSAVLADTVYLQDGSVLKGTLKLLRDGELTLHTAYADELVLPRAQVVGIETDGPVTLRLKDHDAKQDIQARLLFGEDSGQQVVTMPDSDPASPQPLAVNNLSDVRPVGTLGPQAKADQARLAKRRKREAELAEKLWSGRVEAGLQGSSGNSETQTSTAAISIKRERPDNRLTLNAGLRKASQDDEQTEDEARGTARYEQDVSERAFVFTEAQAERDEFEEVDLRYRVTVGPGYFFLQEPDHELKGRLGFGFEQERFEEGENNSNFIATAGYDYRIDLFDWFRLTHEFTYLPALDESPSENYRIESILGAELPLGSIESVWRLRGEWRHDYDNNPEPGIDSTDSRYLIGIARDFR